MSYGASMQRMPADMGEPGKAPASYIKLDETAVMRPSLVAPSFTLIWVPDVGPVPSNTSVRLMVSFTGTPPESRESTAATGSR